MAGKIRFLLLLTLLLESRELAWITDKIGHGENLPKELVENYEKNEEFLRQAHHALLEIEIEEGSLICPETGKSFPIKNGIPNMLLNEDDVGTS